MTPFERSENLIYTFANRMFYSYAMLGYIEGREKLDKECLEAVMSGDFKLMAELTEQQDMFNQQVVKLSFEA
jgi:hypothetical protein|tara:strand:- start:604 stop:819 length:216 start_codon:yes stop_codon:yes gene_type:complete